jgi:catechol 2,3-dioxygenase-like lactoylglutathione lyase family enzyme
LRTKLRLAATASGSPHFLKRSSKTPTEEKAMFSDRKVTVMLPARDIERAIAWYREKLGLKPAQSDQYGAHYALPGGGVAFLYSSDYAGTAKHTLLSFDSPDVRKDMAELRAKGVEFIDYDLPGLKTVNGLAEFGPVKNAWARDSEGNILGFVEGM